MPLGLSPGDFVLDGDTALPKKGAEPPSQFSARLLWPNSWMDQDGTWHGGGPWPRPHCARRGTSSLAPKKGADPQFSANFYCRQTAGCMKMPLGMEVGLSPGDFMLDGEPASPSLKGRSPPIFVRCPLWPNDWMDEDVNWYGSRPRPRPIVLDGVPAPQKRHSSPLPSFRPMSSGQGRPSQLLLSSC